MLEETYIKRLKTIVCKYTRLSPDDTNAMLGDIQLLTNELKSDIAGAIKESGQSGGAGAVDFIAVPQAISIVTQGGKMTERERLELMRDCMSDGDVAEARRILDSLLEKTNV